MSTKTCTKCGETKPLDEYYTDKRTTDGLRSQCKACHGAAAKARRLVDIERTRAREREAYRENIEKEREWGRRSAARRYRANPEKYRERSRKYREANRDKVREYGRKYYAENRDTVLPKNRERARAWNAANRDKVREYGKAYREARPEVAWAAYYRSRARRYGLPVVEEDFTKADVIARYGDACAHCGGPFQELDHYPTSVRDGGHHTLDNVRPSCRRCNRAKAPAQAGITPGEQA